MTMKEFAIGDRKIVSRDEWIEARKTHPANEKEPTHMRDKLSSERRELPWVKVEKEYVFDGPTGNVTLSDLFDGAFWGALFGMLTDKFGIQWMVSYDERQQAA